jgi:glutathione synthase/RimK-type ligase-like ATP-grasp enzyme
MILFCGIPSEPPLQYALDAAETAGIEYALFNQRESHFSEITFDIEAGSITGILRLREVDWPLDAFKGVYIRLMEWNCLPENSPSNQGAPAPERVEKSRLFHQALIEWTEMTDCRVLNRGSAMSSNMSKPYQAQIIARCGFEPPATLITNDPDEVREFLFQHGRVIYKSTSSIRSIVRELCEGDLKNLDRVRSLPTQFQAFIPGTNVRVHVVGEKVFPTRIETDSVDYRYAGRDGQAVAMVETALPYEIQERCVALSKTLDLPLCGIDLKLTPDDQYYCFEVNPSPAYTYYQEQTGQPIAEAIVRYLACDGL